MTRMSFFTLLLLLPGTSVQALYICHPKFTREPPSIMGQSYEEARDDLLNDDWAPVKKSAGKYPEAEWCGTIYNHQGCNFVFKDSSHDYALVVTAESDRNQSALNVTGYYYRCKP